MVPKEDYSISVSRASVQSLLLVIPMAVLALTLYYLSWGGEKIVNDLAMLLEQFGIVFIILIAGICLHELLHGLAWMAAARLPWEAIEYGFKLSALAPYAHCKEPMQLKAYRTGVLAPGFILGLLPYVFGLLTGSGGFIWFGFIFILAAGGDFLMLWIIRKIPAGEYVKDHPERVGCETVS